MAEGTDKDTSEVVEWTIANFSCWNENVHGDVIKSQEFGGVLGVSLKLELRPKGGIGEHLFASIICDEPVFLRGVLSFIGPDGSILSSCEPNGHGALYNFSGPRFDMVVAQIREKEALHEDRLTIKLRMRWKYNKVMLSRTEIVTISSSWNWKLSSPTMRRLTSGFNLISRTFYEQDDDSMGEMDLVALKFDSEIRLRLDHESFQKNVLVFVNISVLGKDGDVLVTAENEHVFLEREDWMFYTSAWPEEIEDSSLILRIKIVPSVKYKHQSAYYMPRFVSRHCLVNPSYDDSQN